MKFALCVSLMDDSPMGAYTVGRKYQVRREHQDGRFEIVDDRGVVQICWWDGLDPDCLWERIG